MASALAGWYDQAISCDTSSHVDNAPSQRLELLLMGGGQLGDGSLLMCCAFFECLYQAEKPHCWEDMNSQLLFETERLSSANYYLKLSKLVLYGPVYLF